MPDWKSLEEIQRDAEAFVSLVHVLLGIYVYEWFITLPFEWDFISGKKPFRWPMIFYFANRYLLLFAMIGIVIGLDTRNQIHCETLFTFIQFAGDSAVGLASINLAIRTMALWSLNRWVVGGLTVIILGHWSLILKGVRITATWVHGNGCVIQETNNTVLAAIFIYSMAFDFIVLMLTAYQLIGLGFGVKKGSGMVKSRIGQMLFGDGLIFFLIAFFANLLATVFMLLNLNAVMSVIFNVPAAVFSTIVACWAVRRLTNFSDQRNNVVLQSVIPITNNFRVGRPCSENEFPPTVHVKVESFTRSSPKQNIDYANFEKRRQDDIISRTEGFPVQLTRTPGEESSEGSGEGSGASSIDLEAKGSGF